MRNLLPRAAPAETGMSSRAVGAMLDRLDAASIECHSLMIVHRGHVVAEGWAAPYSADRPHLLYSLTKSIASIAVGLAVSDGLLSLDDRVVDVLPEHVPHDASDQARRLTVHQLLTMTAGHDVDTLSDAWRLEPGDLVKGFLRQPFAVAEGTQHTYDNATTFVLARMVERVTGRGLPGFLDERLFHPIGVDHAEWDRVGSGAAFGFHGLHLTTEAVAAIGELMLRRGRWHGRQLVPAGWVELATTYRTGSRHYSPGAVGVDFESGYGYHWWMARDGFHANGAFGQHCVVVPSRELVVVVTSEQQEIGHAQDVLDAVHDLLLPGAGRPDDEACDAGLDRRLRRMSLAVVDGSAGPARDVSAVVDAAAEGSALAAGAAVTLTAVDGGWMLGIERIGDIDVGHGQWRGSAPLGRAIFASGAWSDRVFTADVCLVRTPHHVRVTVDADGGTASAIWTSIPLTTPDLMLHLRSPLMTRPDVA